MVRTMAALVVVGVIGAQALALDVPLVVREGDGVARVNCPVNSGVPFPKGAVKDVSKLRLLDASGKPVLASIEERCRWLGDESLKWVTVHFLANVPAKGERTYVLTDKGGPAATGPLTVSKRGGTIVVVTGPAKFVIGTSALAPFQQVYVRSDPSKDFTETDALLAGPSVVRLAGRNGEMRVKNRKAELVGLEAPFQQTARVRSAVIEERGPGRAVVALKGTFSTREAKSLDFTARLYFYAGSPLAQMTFSVRNRQLKSMARFVGIDRLAVEVPLRKGASRPQCKVAVDGKTVTAQLTGGAASLLQTAWNKNRFARPNSEAVTGKQSPGWVRVATGEATLTAGNRWFWQTYPKGLRVTADGVVSLELAPTEGKRIDLFNAGAKTHFLFFHFAKGSTPEPGTIAAATTHPLAAVCDPSWYCEKTRVFGDLYANEPENFQPKYRELVARFQKNVDRSIRQIVKQRPRTNWPFGVDEYGWLDFGSGLHHRTTTKNTSEESWWDSNYYGFPHAVLINYLRTGDEFNLRTAEEAGLHLADIDICHSFPGRPNRAGSPRSGPVLGHFRNYAGGQIYMGHDSFTFYKNESLYELYYLTGERWYREIGLMSSDFAMAFWGKGALRNVAHGIWGVLSAYHDTHEKKYLDRAQFFVDKWAKPWQDQGGGGFKHPRIKDQDWMYGLQFEAYHKYWQVAGDVEAVRYNVRAVDYLIEEYWEKNRATKGLPGMVVNGFGYAYEYTGNEDYLNRGLRILEMTTKAGGTRVKTFAQQFRASPYFLTVLTEGYKPPVVMEK